MLNNNKKEQTPICEGVSKGHDSQLKESPMTKAGTTWGKKLVVFDYNAKYEINICKSIVI